MGKLIFILGGARSGKSNFAEARAREAGGNDVLYVATATVADEEMRRRVQLHRERRPAAWCTLEAPHAVADAIREHTGDAHTILVDCLSVMVANPLMAPEADPFDEALEAQVLAEVEALAGCAKTVVGEMLVVSNEVGMGVVPGYPLGRAYRDVLGRANQALAARADEVYFVVAGIPQRIK